jgi:hypothetical protein
MSVGPAVTGVRDRSYGCDESRTGRGVDVHRGEVRAGAGGVPDVAKDHG